MAINFPNSPALNDEFTEGEKVWRWNGFRWRAIPASLINVRQQLAIANSTIDTLNSSLTTANNNLTTLTSTLDTVSSNKADATTVTNSLETKSDITKSLDEITSNYTLDLDDAGKILKCTNTNAITITIPLESIPFDDETDFPIGSEIGIVRLGSGSITISGSLGVTIRSTDNKLKIKGQYSSGALLKIATNEWMLAGSLEA